MSPIFEILLALASIAGVFVGFGALVVLSDHGAARISEMHSVRAVVLIGIITLVGALMPVGLGSFELSDRVLWGWSGGAFLVLIWFSLTHSTNRPVLLTMMRTDLKASLFFWLVLEPPIQIPLLFCIFGTFPQHAPAFYVVAVVVNLFQCALTLVQVVFARVQRLGDGSP